MHGTHFARRTSAIFCGVLILAVASTASAAASSPYVVTSGDTVSGIAMRYGVSIQQIVAHNGLSNPNLIFAGQALTLPAGQSGEGANAAVQESGGTYTVQSGDTMWGIASQFGISVAQLVELNRDRVVDQHLIYEGQTIAVPGGETPIAEPESASQAANTGVSAAQLMHDTAVAYGIDPALIKALAWQESGWQQGVVSSAGALGVMQVMPSTGGWVATELVGRPLNIAESPSDNILAGVVYLEWLIRYTGDENLALASYYQGPGSVSSYGMLAETRRYVDNIQAIRSHIQQYGAPPT